MRNVPTQKSLRILYPTITPRTAKLCREIMRAQLDPLDRPDMFPKTRDLFTVDFIPTPPRMIRMLAIAELCKAEPDLNPDAPICAHYGVCYPAQYTSHTAKIYWLHNPAGDDALTLCSAAPPPPPPRRAVQRDPWLYRDWPTIETYHVAVPAALAKKIAKRDKNLSNQY